MTATTDALRALLEAVKAGALPDEDWRLMRDIWSPRNWHDLGHNVRYAFHGSLDAAKALHDAVLPGWHGSFSTDGFARVAKGGRVLTVMESCHVDCKPARAWLIAILVALIAKDTAND